MPSLAPSTRTSGAPEATGVSIASQNNHQAILIGLSIACILLFLLFIGLITYVFVNRRKNENANEKKNENNSFGSLSYGFKFNLFKQQPDLEGGTERRRISASNISKPRLLFGTGPFAVNFSNSNSWKAFDGGKPTEEHADNIENPFTVGDDDNEDGDDQQSNWLPPLCGMAGRVSPNHVEAISTGAVACRQPKLEGVSGSYNEHAREHAAQHIVECSEKSTVEHTVEHSIGQVAEHTAEHAVEHLAERIVEKNEQLSTEHNEELCVDKSSTKVVISPNLDEKETTEVEYSDNDGPAESLRDSLRDIITSELISEIEELAKTFRELDIAFPDENNCPEVRDDGRCLSDSSSIFGFDTSNSNESSVTSVESDRVQFHKSPHHGILRPVCTDPRIKEDALRSLCNNRIKARRDLELRFPISTPFTRDPSTYLRASAPAQDWYAAQHPDCKETPEPTQQRGNDNKPKISSPLVPGEGPKSRSRRLEEAVLTRVSSRKDLNDGAETAGSSYFMKQKSTVELNVTVHKCNVSRQGIISSLMMNLNGVDPFADSYAYQSPFEDPVICHPGKPAPKPVPRPRTIGRPVTRRRETAAFKGTGTASRHTRQDPVSKPVPHQKFVKSPQRPPVTTVKAVDGGDLLLPSTRPLTIRKSLPRGKQADALPDKVASTSKNTVATTESRRPSSNLAYRFPSPPTFVEDHLRCASSADEHPGNRQESTNHPCRTPSTNECIENQQPASQLKTPTLTERPMRPDSIPPRSLPNTRKEPCRRHQGLSDISNKNPKFVLSSRRGRRLPPPGPPPSIPLPSIPLPPIPSTSRHSSKFSRSSTPDENLNPKKRAVPMRNLPDATTKSSTNNSKTTSPSKGVFKV